MQPFASSPLPFVSSLRIVPCSLIAITACWIGATLTLGLVAFALYLYFCATTPGGLTGGSLVGMWYGIVGSGLMVYAGLLSALRKVPSWWWLGSRKVWLRGHIWLGLLSGLFLLCHSGFRWGGPLEVALWVVVILTLATGVLGLALAARRPAVCCGRASPARPPMSRSRTCATSCATRPMRRSAGILADQSLSPVARQNVEQFHQEKLRPFLHSRYDRSSPLASPLQAELIFARLRKLADEGPIQQQLSQLESFCDERRQWGQQERYHFWLHSWLLVHVPLSVLVLVLGTAHVVASLYY